MTAQRKPTYTQVNSRYESLRQTSRETTLDALASVLSNSHGERILKESITLEGYTFDCQRELEKWENSGLRRVTWDWKKVIRKYKTHPKRFELSVWYKDLYMCGASMGRPTWGGDRLRLDYLESAPQGSPLDGLITDITIAVGVIYARSIGASQLRIMNPVNDSVKKHYLSKPNFSYDQSGDYCYRDLS